MVQSLCVIGVLSSVDVVKYTSASSSWTPPVQRVTYVLVVSHLPPKLKTGEEPHWEEKKKEENKRLSAEVVKEAKEAKEAKAVKKLAVAEKKRDKKGAEKDANVVKKVEKKVEDKVQEVQKSKKAKEA